MITVLSWRVASTSMLLVGLLVGGHACSSGAPETSTATIERVDVAAYVNRVMEVVEERAYYADRLDIAALREEGMAAAADADETSDVYGWVRRVVGALEDRHSSFFPPSTVEALERADDQPSVVPEVSSDEGVLYIAVPGTGAAPGSEAGRAYVRAAWAATEAETLCGVIVDVTANRGGNVFTMLSALGPVLGVGRTVRYVDRNDGAITYVVEPDGSIAADDDATLAPAPDRFEPVGVPVAVLQGPSTASSGEAVVMAFLGRPRSRTFGTPTAGLPTGNEFIKLPDGSALNVTGSVGVDFAGEAHDTSITPQQHVDGLTSAREAAASWLRQSEPCRGSS